VTDLWIKICGLTSVRDAEMVVRAGADAIGLNFVSSSPRRIAIPLAREIARAVQGRVELVGVFANQPVSEVLAIKAEVGLDWIQLHGDEPSEAVEQCGPRTMKALRVADAADVARADLFAGRRLLVDTKVSGALGGTGQTFDWSLVDRLARERELLLAGGLGPDNVALAVQKVRPFGIDTASGVESSPGAKSPEITRAFIERARAASSALQGQG
jgi:phosphoribosylanthranilate isomerase